ncbi:MAG: TetR/AcrR family transcriptional regulator [Solirubrobacteraceae bacterium]
MSANPFDAGTEEIPSARPISEFSPEELADLRRRLRDLQDDRPAPGEGLRERKKRQTRQEISDVATFLFMSRGFDEVRIAEVAEAAGVSEKTVYNYFPTKESLVFDREEAASAALREALGRPGVSPTDAVIQLLEREFRDIGQLGPGLRPIILEFSRMISETPALRRAAQEMAGRMTDVATEALAEAAQVDPGDPEPRIAAHALIGLWEIHMTARRRRLHDGTPSEEIGERVMEDTRRAARLLDNGLWAFHTIARGGSTRSQLTDAARAAGEGGRQVVAALRQARAAWLEARDGQGR